MGRVRGHSDWKTRAWTVALLEQVQAVLSEYPDYLPLTLRQGFCRLVGAPGAPRRDDPWEALRDGFAPHLPYYSRSPEESVDTLIHELRNFRLESPTSSCGARGPTTHPDAARPTTPRLWTLGGARSPSLPKPDDARPRKREVLPGRWRIAGFDLP